jgi:hypothetical protein
MFLAPSLGTPNDKTPQPLAIPGGVNLGKFGYSFGKLAVASLVLEYFLPGLFALLPNPLRQNDTNLPFP